MGIGAVILAAGASSRMGEPKQLLPFRGESLLRRAARAAQDAGCRPIVVVTGAHAESMRRELEGLDVREVWNPRWEMGMGSSIRAGIEALAGSDQDMDAAVFMLCDQPHVTGQVVARLAEAHRETGKHVIASSYGGNPGVPALFGRSLFPELTRLKGATGAKQVLRRHASEACLIPFSEGEIDIDTPDDYSRLIASEGSRQVSMASVSRPAPPVEPAFLSRQVLEGPSPGGARTAGSLLRPRPDSP